MNEALITPADRRRRTKAAALVQSMRERLAQLEHYLGAVDALPGDLWLDALESAELATQRAYRITTTDGNARLAR